MRGIDSLRNRGVEIWWALFAAVNVAAMVAWPAWETIPFHFVWISLTLVYGFRVWSSRATASVLVVVIVCTGASIMADAFEGIQLWGELFEVPLMSAMFVAMVWHARRRQTALGEVEAMLGRQERFLHDVTHELRTPVTIAQGHLELLQRDGSASQELVIALDELKRIERIIANLLLLAEAGQSSFLAPEAIDAESFLEDIFIRWSEVAPRAWRLGPLVGGCVCADEEALRCALDALLENAVKYTMPTDSIELRARVPESGLVIDVIDTGSGIAPDAIDRIFDRFARGDDARARTNGGVGLGLSIVAAVAKAHGGSCTVTSHPHRTMFSLHLPEYEPVQVSAGQVIEPPVHQQGRDAVGYDERSSARELNQVRPQVRADRRP